MAPESAGLPESHCPLPVPRSRLCRPPKGPASVNGITSPARVAVRIAKHRSFDGGSVLTAGISARSARRLLANLRRNAVLPAIAQNGLVSAPRQPVRPRGYGQTTPSRNAIEGHEGPERMGVRTRPSLIPARPSVLAGIVTSGKNHRLRNRGNTRRLPGVRHHTPPPNRGQRPSSTATRAPS